MDEYFNVKPQGSIYSDISDLHRQRILQDSARVYKDGQGSLDLISWPKNAKGGLHPVSLSPRP